MAIFPDVPGLSVEIYAGDKALQEYDDDEDSVAPKSVTKYVEASTGAEFEVRYRFSREFYDDHPPFPDDHGADVEVVVDGKKQTMTHTHTREEGRNTRQKCCPDFVCDVDGKTCTQNFRFAELSIGDVEEDESTETQTEDLGKIGLIQVSFYAVDGIRKYRKTTVIPSMQDAVFGTIPERALKGKAISHQTSFGKPKPLSSQGWLLSDPVGGSKEKAHIATFRFKYRSHAALQAMLIVPRSPNLNALSLEEQPDDHVRELAPSEVRAMRSRSKRQDEQAAKALKAHAAKTQTAKAKQAQPQQPMQMQLAFRPRKRVERDDDDEDMADAGEAGLRTKRARNGAGDYGRRK